MTAIQLIAAALVLWAATVGLVLTFFAGVARAQRRRPHRDELALRRMQHRHPSSTHRSAS